MSFKFDFSVIIPSHHREDSAIQTAKSVICQAFPQSRVEIIIVANPHSPNLFSFTEQYKNIRYFESPVGVNKAKNKALENVQGEFVLFMDDDCTLDNPLHLSIVKTLLSDDNCDGVGGCYIGASKATLASVAYNKMANAWLRQFVRRDSSTTQLLGGNCAYKALTIDGIKFDENIRYGGDEVGFNWSLVRAGKRLRFVENLFVTHHERGDLMNYIRRASRQGWNKNQPPRQSSTVSALRHEFKDMNWKETVEVGGFIGLYQIFGRSSSVISQIF